MKILKIIFLVSLFFINNTIVFAKDMDGVRTPAECNLYIDEKYIDINGKQIEFQNAPFLKDNYTMLALREIIEIINSELSMDNNIEWNGDEKIATMVFGSRVSKIDLSNNSLYVNGFLVETDKEAEVENGNIYIPFRSFIIMIGGADSSINWDNNLKCINFEV